MTVLFWTVALNLKSQSTKIDGKWEVKAIDNGEFFMDIKTDSLMLYDAFDYVRGDSFKIKKIKEMARLVYFDQHFIFDHHKFSQLSSNGFFQMESNFRIESDSIIGVYQLNTGDTTDYHQMKYSLNEDVLFLEIPLTDPSVKVHLVK